MIRILSGMIFLMAEIMRFENAVTTITDKAITIDGFICTVTARAEQMPNTWTVMGLLSLRGSLRSFLFFTENGASLCFFTTTGATLVSVAIINGLMS